MQNQSHYTETFTEPQVLFSMILENLLFDLIVSVNEWSESQNKLKQ